MQLSTVADVLSGEDTLNSANTTSARNTSDRSKNGKKRYVKKKKKKDKRTSNLPCIRRTSKMSIYLLACRNETDERAGVITCDVIIVSSLVAQEEVPRVTSGAVLGKEVCPIYE